MVPSPNHFPGAASMEIAAPAIPFKFKRRNISAVRRFPPPLRPPVEVPVESGTLGEPELVEARALAKRVRVAEFLEEGSLKKPETPPVTSKRYPLPKRRRVSAVREYPAGCGRTAARIIGDEGGLKVVAPMMSPKIKSLDSEKERSRSEKGKRKLVREKMEVERVGTKQKQGFLEEKDGENNIVAVNQRRAAEGLVGVAYTDNAEMRLETKREQGLRWEKKPFVYHRPEAGGPLQDSCTENASIEVERIVTKQNQELFPEKKGEKKLAVNQRPGDEASVGVTRTENAKMGVKRVVTKQMRDFVREKEAVANHRPATEGFVGVTCTENTKMEAKRGETKQKQEFLRKKDGEKKHVRFTCIENVKVETKQNQKLFKQKDREESTVKLLSQPEGSIRVASMEKSHDEARRNVKQFQDRIREISSESRFKPALEGSPGEITVKERTENKISVRLGLGRKPEGHEAEQFSKSLCIKEAQESEPYPKLCLGEARRNVKQTRERAEDINNESRVKPASKGNLGENAVEERIEKKILVRSSLERKLEMHDREKLGKSLPIKGARESKPSLEFRKKSGTKFIIKVGGSMVGRPFADAKFAKRKFAEAENRGCDPSNRTGGDGGLKTTGGRMIVQTQIAAQTCPLGQARKSDGTSNRSVTSENLKKQGKSWSKNSDFKGASASRHKNDENEKDPAVYKFPPVVPLEPNHKGRCNEDVSARSKVKRALRLFQALARMLLQEEESKSKSLGRANRIDLKVAGILKNNHQWVNRGEPILGPVPGVEVGDEFHYRVELSIVGLHRPFQGGIDRTKKNGMDLATSIVASGGYPDDMDSSDVLIYNGSGGIAIGKNKQIGDQKLERGNLALKNSIDAKNPVRVIYGFKELKESEDDARVKPVSTFTYDGLYLVEKYWTEKGPHGFSVFKFQLRRMAGQPELALKEVKRSKMAKVREGLFQNDISQGKETMPICALNTTDDDRPIPFTYITKNIYPSWYVHKPPRGCDCTDGCLDNENCACAVKNGGGIPFNHNGAIVQAKSLIYECGPSCNCRSCYNRVSQRGIKIPLEIFKTKSRGWGVRSLYSIPSGSFICEYVGELLKESEAQDRVNDEYLFEIGHNYEDKTLLEGLPSLLSGFQSNVADEPVVDLGFTIDAAEYGNIGRFINHSCSPNIYAQNVLYDHDDKRMPHIMFFAADNIPPLQELTWDYNYRVDQVHDSDGNIKRKNCYCGSPECTGRLY